jgi:hypothetical protein
MKAERGTSSEGNRGGTRVKENWMPGVGEAGSRETKPLVSQWLLYFLPFVTTSSQNFDSVSLNFVLQNGRVVTTPQT